MSTIFSRSFAFLFSTNLIKQESIVSKGESVVSPKIIHQWHVNEFVVYLIQEHSSLRYRTIDENRQEIYTSMIEIPESDTLEERICHLKRCKVMVEKNGTARFFSTYHTWKNSNRKTYKIFEKITASPIHDFVQSFSYYRKWEYDPTTEVHLNRGSGELIWNVCRRFSKKDSSFHSFQESTIPSMRCHPETIALIERIKREAFSNKELLYCFITNFTIRIMDPDFFQKELEVEKNIVEVEHFSNQCKQERFLLQNKKITYPLIAMSFYLSRNAIVATANSVSKCLGNGILATATGAYIGLCTGSTLASTALCGTQAITSYFSPYSLPSSIRKKQEALQERAAFATIKRPFLIEIEPISAPSEIDPRMRVSKFTWAVTVVNGLKGPSKNHTAILIEGLANEYFQGAVPEGEYFLHKSEFNPPVRSHLYSLRLLKMYSSQGMRRTEIWMKPSKQVIVMLQEIARQQHLHEQQMEKREKIKWAITGSDSWFSGGLDNCFTWARKTVSLLDIELGKNFHSGMFAWPRSFTDTFEEQRKTLFVDIKI
ncbi:MAG: hypothetical protein LBC45_03250 [Chlamydiales bacterium]|jgi:hypothetical protein|nr:hypothetical protein [Chlamydiales bacterium]